MRCAVSNLNALFPSAATGAATLVTPAVTAKNSSKLDEAVKRAAKQNGLKISDKTVVRAYKRTRN